jgi:hypothetical protein
MFFYTLKPKLYYFSRFSHPFSTINFRDAQGRIKVFAGPGQLALWGPVDKHKSKKSTLNGAAGEIFGESGPIAEFS